jgi:hypothetical protein
MHWLRARGRVAVAPEAPRAADFPAARAAFAEALRRVDGRDAWLDYLAGSEEERDGRYRLDQAIARELPHGPFWFYCSIGEHAVGVEPTAAHDHAVPFDWREQAACPNCGLNARMRFCLELMRLELAPVPQPRVYLTEQATHGYAAAARLFPAALGSEFVFDEQRKAALQDYLRMLTGDARQVLRSEDVTALTFEDASLDAVGSFEVLEHVPDYQQALAEFARVLVPGGLLVLTAPFLDHRDATLVRARLGADGAVEHLEVPEYHGDPTSPDGALCFYHFGWDLADALRRAGFDRVEYVTGWSLSLGLLGAIGAFVARRG